MPTILKDASSQSIDVFLQSIASGTGVTGVAHNASGLAVWFRRGSRTQPAKVGLNTLASADSAYTSGGWVEVNSSSMPGQYRLDLPDASVATGVDRVYFYVQMTNGTLPYPFEVELVDALDVSAGKVNVGMINGVLVSGVGTSANPWGPA